MDFGKKNSSDGCLSPLNHPIAVSELNRFDNLTDVLILKRVCKWFRITQKALTIPILLSLPVVIYLSNDVGHPFQRLLFEPLGDYFANSHRHPYET